MAKAIPNPDMPLHGNVRRQLQSGSEDRAIRNAEGATSSPHPVKLDFWSADQDTPTDVANAEEMAHLRLENEQLRRSIAEIRENLEDVHKRDDQVANERLKEYESLLEEKSELIRNLHLKIQELSEQRPVAQTPKEEELLALSEELERERCQLQQDRRQMEDERKQLAEDEESMVKQMRDMEVQMARERADFARQRTELNRVYEEIRREMENIERNGLLNQRLGQLRQRFQDVINPKGSAPSISKSSPPPGPRPEGTAQPVGEPEVAPKRAQSFLGRLFG
jgi:hypothetical protein